MGWFGPRSGACSCCAPPCDPIPDCECGDPSAPFDCFTLSVSGIGPSASGLGVDYSDYLNADYIAICGSNHESMGPGAGEANDVYTTDGQYVCSTGAYWRWEFTATAGGGTLCLRVASLAVNGTSGPGNPGSWAKIHKWCWEFNHAADANGCAYRLCEPTLVSEYECCVEWSGPVFPADPPLSTVLDCEYTFGCSGLMPINAGDAADHLLDFSGISVSVSYAPCP